MSKIQNIWEVVNLNDLVKILKENEKKFVVIGLCLENNSDDIKKSVKKFLKTYAKIYKNLTFLYYNVQLKDLGRISLITKNVEEYPFIYHVYDVSNIFVSVNRANNQTMYEAMKAVEEYYKKDMVNFIQKQHIINEPNNELNNEPNNEPNNQMNDEMNEEMNRKVLEHQQLLEKLVIFEEMKKKHNIEFLSDIQKRKKDEQKKK